MHINLAAAIWFLLGTAGHRMFLLAHRVIRFLADLISFARHIVTTLLKSDYEQLDD